MRVRQYVCFALRSSMLSAEEIAARVGLEPVEVTVRGSRSAEPPRPVWHAWKIVCRERGLTVDEQIGRVMERIRPHQDRISALTADEPEAVLQVVRYFDYPDGEEEELSPPDAPLQKLAGQHQLLGWALERDLLEFLLLTGAILDVDEYG